MANLSLKHIYKVYPNGVQAVSDFNMEIKDKEFIVFVGPSGCGKSTTLRMIAGLEDITAGELFIGDKLVNSMEPKERDIAMVFQNYALYPHMTVYDNMAFGLKLQHMDPAVIHEKILWAANILGITDYLDRKPRAMSGGQRQRVALGRAILRNPKVFLLDEPLSNLDAKLRTQMRAEISKLHQQLGTTFIYVTHDQVEAMTMGTRIVVMKLGKVQQIDTPKNLYDYPCNKFVAGFIGTPQMNFFEATLKREKNMVEIKFDYCNDVLHIPFNDLLKVQPIYFNGKKKVYVGIRSEHLKIIDKPTIRDKNLLKIKVSHFEELGSETLIYGDLNEKGDGFVESSTRIIVKSNSGYLGIKPNDYIYAKLDVSKLHFFDKVTEETIIPRIPVTNLFDAKVTDNVLKFENVEVKLPRAFAIKNVDKCNFYLPLDALKINGKDFKAVVKEIEKIDKINLAYLEINKRIFFAKVSDSIKVGQEVSLGIDFTRISLEKDDEIIISPLQEFDTVLASLSSISSFKYSKKYAFKFAKEEVEKAIFEVKEKERKAIEKLSIDDSLAKQYKLEYKQKVEKIKLECYTRIQKADLGKKGKENIKKEEKERLTLAKKNYNMQLEVLAKRKEEYDSKSSEEKNNILKQIEEIKKPFEELIATYKYYLEKYEKDYSIEFDFMKKDSKESFLLAQKELSLVEKDGKELQKSRLKQDKEILKSKKDKKVDIKNISLSPITEKEEKYNICKENYEFAKIQAYFNVAGHLIKSSKEIETKVVQALGAKSFIDMYKLEIPHNAYVLSNRGIAIKVDDFLDYGNIKLIKSSILGRTIYVKVDKKYDKGEILKISIDINKVQLYQYKFNIRLY